MKNTLEFYQNIYEPLFRKKKLKYSTQFTTSWTSLMAFYALARKENLEIKKVIDVGCARGKTFKSWLEHNIDVVGVDVSQLAVNKCIKKGFKAHVASVTDLSIFPDQSFDLYFATDIYEHLRTEDLDDAIEEAKRITKKYFLIKPFPGEDARKSLHLTCWSLGEWEDFF